MATQALFSLFRDRRSSSCKKRESLAAAFRVQQLVDTAYWYHRRWDRKLLWATKIIETLKCIYDRSDITAKVKVKISQPEPCYKVSALQVQLEESLIHNPERQPRVRQEEQLKLLLDGCESLQHSPHGCWRPSQHQLRSEDTTEIWVCWLSCDV